MTNIVIAGVGGQGSLLASKILGYLYMSKGRQVKVSEVHGMSQRGGSVVTTVRAGEVVRSPLVTPGEADMLIALERLEALRWHYMLGRGGTLVASTQTIPPMTVITGTGVYPEERPEGVWLDALECARKAGSVRAANIAALGAASAFLEFGREEWLSALDALLPEPLREVNKKALLLGAEAASEYKKGSTSTGTK
ncbi:MAG: indolepyruvate oxidoreductase subunit beta [Oscillospiraceae bacterium]|jgi:indolepyruvate ferredoxin oxidoreductase beta subunit|nr:indolepyruvate oxidoreductase subunit beta [Oscillospiraceae bacterium]